MRRLLCTLFFTMIACAQPDSGEAIIERLNGHLLPLKSLPGVDVPFIDIRNSAANRAAVAKSHPEQNKIMLSYSMEIYHLYRKSVIPWDHAYVLTSALAGKNLSPQTLTPLTRSIIALLNSALDCFDERCKPGQSQQFRLTCLDAHAALIGVGVSVPNARRVQEKLLRAGSLIVNRPHVFNGPIPRALPHQTPRWPY